MAASVSSAERPQPFVAIAIPTYRRPEMLRTLLDALAAQKDAPPFVIVIADNDAQRQEGLAVARQWQDEQADRIAVDAFLVEGKGLCHVRNALLTHALAHPQVTHVALLDDDNWPEPDWLARFIAAQEKSGVDVVGGPITYVFDGPRPSWADQILVFRTDDRSDGPATIWGTPNVMLRRTVIEAADQPWFDPRFNVTGGEDMDFFTRLRARGATMHWVSGARVNERVPTNRANLPWAMRRMWRIGQTDMLVAQKYAGKAGQIVLPLRALALLGMQSAMLPLMALPGRQRFDFAGKWVKSVGRLSIYFGASAAPYK